MSEPNRAGGPTDDPGLARLFRDAAREEPPAHLDAAILAAAHRDAGARPRLWGSAWLRSWRLPVSIAAVVALSVSLVTMVLNEGGDRLTAPPPRPADSPAKSRVEQDDVAARPVPAEPTSPATTPAPTTGAVGTRQRIPEGRAAANTHAKQATRTDAVEASRTAPQPFPEAPTSGTGEPHGAAASAPRRQDGTRRPSATTTDSPAAASETPADSPRPPPVVAEEYSVGGANTPFIGGSAAPGVAASVGPPALQNSALIREYENQAPEKWLEKIAELRRNGRSAEADRMLAEFKKRFPEHPLTPARR